MSKHTCIRLQKDEQGKIRQLNENLESYSSLVPDKLQMSRHLSHSTAFLRDLYGKKRRHLRLHFDALKHVLAAEI
jgi:hypothetical protein